MYTFVTPEKADFRLDFRREPWYVLIGTNRKDGAMKIRIAELLRPSGAGVPESRSAVARSRIRPVSESEGGHADGGCREENVQPDR